MIINLNGWPGVGKLTVGMVLTKKMNGRFLDNHTILNVAKALTEPGSPEYYETSCAIRAVAFNRILKLPAQVPIILTNVVARGGKSEFLEENWQAVLDLASRRHCDLYSVTLTCSLSENARRVASEERILNRKIHDPNRLTKLASERVLFDDGATYRTTLDNTFLAPDECSNQISLWIKGCC